MMTNELIDMLKCHVMRHGNCQVELLIENKKGRKFAASLKGVVRAGCSSVGHGPWDDRRPVKPGPMAILKGEV